MSELPMRTARTAGVTILITIALWGCNTRLAVDFETDTVGQLPSRSPPGPPDDEVDIEFIGAQNPPRGVLARVTEEQVSPISGETRYLSLSFPADADMDSIARFRSSSLATGTQSLFFQWEQILDGDGVAELIVHADPPDDDDNLIICRLEVANDLIRFKCDSSDDQDPATITGIDTASLHTLQLRIDRSPHRAALSIVQDGEATELATAAVEAATQPAEGQRVAVQVVYRGQVEGALRINNFHISERDPN